MERAAAVAGLRWQQVNLRDYERLQHPELEAALRVSTTLSTDEWAALSSGVRERLKKSRETGDGELRYTTVVKVDGVQLAPVGDGRWVPSQLVRQFAQVLTGLDVDALRRILQVPEPSQLTPEETRQALAEPLFASAGVAGGEGAPAVSSGLSTHGSEDALIECITGCDASTLRNLKAVSLAWARRARRVLASAEWRERCGILTPALCALARCTPVGWGFA